MAWGDIPDGIEIVTKTLLAALRERDPYTYGHCRRVSRNARLLAKAAGLRPADQQVVEFASLFHDLGKIAIPDRVLMKPGKLTPEEEAIIRIHPVKSVEILEPLTVHPFFQSLIPGILYHHERIDGRGYPEGVKGDKIPLHARIILIADTFDALVTTRPYRRGKGFEFAYKELERFAGRQFDGELVKIFLKAHPNWGSIEEEITEEFVSRNFRRAA